MKESASYQAILEEGAQIGFSRAKSEGVRDMLIRVGTKKFGAAPNARVLALLEAVSDVKRLGDLGDRVLDVSGWDELLADN
jgi:hypothetical protein